ncbi:MAG: YaiI/YqxD family protein [Reyranella sp.]|nr:MAG: YaiI/YqxD family protein [Reyranella sp.]
MVGELDPRRRQDTELGGARIANRELQPGCLVVLPFHLVIPTEAGDARPVTISLYIDADACPVKTEIYRVAERYALKVYVVSNSYINVPRDPRIERVVVSDGFDAADDWIAERVGPRDIVITSDIPLADRSLKKGAAAIGSTGVAFTTSSIGMAMASRELMSNLRAMGEMTGGPKPMSPRDRSRFLSTLDETIQKLRRASGGG